MRYGNVCVLGHKIHVRKRGTSFQISLGRKITKSGRREQITRPSISECMRLAEAVIAHEKVSDDKICVQGSKRIKPEHVYVLHAAGTNLYKIGIAADVLKRADTLQTGCPHEIQIDDIMDYPRPAIVERILHNEFKECHVRGEWFSLTPAQRMDLWMKMHVFVNDFPLSNLEAIES